MEITCIIEYLMVNQRISLSKLIKHSQNLHFRPGRSFLLHIKKTSFLANSTLINLGTAQAQQYEFDILNLVQIAFTCSNTCLQQFDIQREGPDIMQEGKISSENVASEREKVVEVKRKIGILKEALLAERKGNRQLEQQLYERGERLKKMELQSKKREEKNEALLLEIRSLKDALITERTEKQEAAQHLVQLQQQEKTENSGQNKKSLSNMFGWKSLFHK